MNGDCRVLRPDLLIENSPCRRACWFAPMPYMNRKTRSYQRPCGLSLEPLETRITPAIAIALDYRFGSQGFFNDPARCSVLQFAADSLAVRLNDTLSAIVPFGTNTWTAKFTAPDTGIIASLPNFVVPTNTIVLFVGARDLPAGGELGEGGPGGFDASGDQDWLATVVARGQTGAVGPDNEQTDFGPWGGSVAFDSLANWYFGQDTPDLGGGQNDFLSVAVHEIGHTLGFGTASSWTNLVSGNLFTGGAARAQYGSDVPTDASGAAASHWANNIRDRGTAGLPHAAMDPVIPQGTRKTFTPLDFAALQDLGWEVQGVSGEVQGTVYADLNGTGTADADEPGLGNRVVFADLNGNGLPNVGEPATTTAADGTYTLNLQPSAANYSLRLQTQVGEIPAEPVGGLYTLSVTAGSTFPNRSFGINALAAGHVMGQVFRDSNASGSANAGEGPLSGRAVFADLNGNGVLDSGEPSTATLADGTYNLTLQPQVSPYSIRFAGGGGDLVSFPAAASYSITVIAGATTATRDFGVVLTSVAVPLLLPPSTPFVPQGDATADYVEALYRSILHRNGGPAEYAAWVNLLNANPAARPIAVQAFWNSAEHRGLQVDTFYAQILQRSPDASGRAFWVGVLEQGASEEAIAILFLESPEFLNHGNQFFVDFLYQSVLGRAYDATGEEFWLNSLANEQLTHDQVVLSFLFSPESLRRLVNGYYSVYLNRAVDTAGEDFWVNQLSTGLPFANIAKQFLATDEFFASGGR
ncbi:hypothetical protein BH10PLA2_BH10PLA2_31530 [soil metagenome]